MKGHKGMERVPAIRAKSVLCSSSKISRLSRDHPEQFFFFGQKIGRWMCLNRFGAESEAPLLCFFEFFFFHYLKKKEEKEKEPTIFEVKNMETGKKKREELSRWNELEMSNSAHFVRLPHLKKKKKWFRRFNFGHQGTLEPFGNGAVECKWLERAPPFTWRFSPVPGRRPADDSFWLFVCCNVVVVVGLSAGSFFTARRC